MRYLVLIPTLLLLIPLAGCCATQPAEQAYTVNSLGQVSAATRSAMDGSTAPGKQELIGVYLPFIGTGLAVKAAVEWDGTPPPGVITIPVPVSSSPQAQPSSCGYAAPVAAPQTVTIPIPRPVMTPYVVPASCP